MKIINDLGGRARAAEITQIKNCRTVFRSLYQLRKHGLIKQELIKGYSYYELTLNGVREHWVNAFIPSSERLSVVAAQEVKYREALS